MTTLYLKYRPQKIDELDIAEARESLGKIVKSGEVPHAFLFSGPKGTGKTSAARIIAKIVNCESGGAKPCDKCDQCKSISVGGNIDVIEIDAASHRGIDDVRTLRDAVKLSPAQAKKKVYIIDEAHMLTTEASNALLKTLEEPPEHVMFILATTNPEKLIPTIRSRTTNINFRKATDDEVIRSLLRVVAGEKKKISEASLSLIAKAANGSFRDATKILEQLFTEEKSLAEEDIKEYLFQTKEKDQRLPVNNSQLYS
jgi:DNA polymerase-3 subunit gamma/tau